MTKEEIIELARESGLLAEDEAWVSPHQEAMERFASIIAAKERERCAKIGDKYDYGITNCGDEIRGLK